MNNEMTLGTQPKGTGRGRGGEGGVGLLVRECSYSSTNLVGLKKKVGHKAPPIHTGLLRKVKSEVEL